MHFPERIRRAFRNRRDEADMKSQREHTLKLETEGNLQKADTPERLERRKKALLHCDRQMVDAIARGRESLLGATTDFLGIAFLERAQLAARSVARVATPKGQGFGSGFMVAPGLFLTNNHVLPDVAAAKDVLIEFEYELDASDQPKQVTRFALKPEHFFLTSAETDLDFTIVAVGARSGRGRDLSWYGHVPLIGTNDKHVLGEWVNIVQHPDADLKQMTIRENLLVSRLKHVLHYKADTMPGSSGSPVFNDQWEVVALHHYGEPFRQKGRRGMDLNEGIRVSSIVEQLRSGKLKPEHGTTRQLQPVLDAQRGERFTGGGFTGTDKPQTVRVREDGTTVVTVPLEVALRLPTLLQSTEQPPRAIAGAHYTETNAAGGERVRIDKDYSNREGYKKDFIDGQSVPLPTMTAARKRLLAKLLQPGTGMNAHLLHYEHFSLVMHAQRRLAMFTATNIEGASWKRLNRDESPRGAESTEVWFNDERLDDAYQCSDRMYDDQPGPPHRMDRGHLVRREYPNWGLVDTARRGNSDTFHITNCAPQAASFNRGSTLWAGVEAYIIRQSDKSNEKVCVFTGPVFRDDDPVWKGLQVPLRFWKVLVREVDGKLRATGFLLDQSEQVPGVLRAAREVFEPMKKAIAEHQARISEIGKLAKLDFGKLTKCDTFGSGGGESKREGGSPKRLLRSLKEVRW